MVNDQDTLKVQDKTCKNQTQYITVFVTQMTMKQNNFGSEIVYPVRIRTADLHDHK
jgi:hypothetical protein